MQQATRAGALALVTLCGFAGTAGAGAFFFVDADGEEEWITHPVGYDGTGGTLSVTLCIDPMSANAAAMELSVENAVRTYNALEATTANLVSGGANNIPSGDFDFESVVVHELGHCLGLAHPNLGLESGLIGSFRDFARATDGADNDYDVGDDGDSGGPGVDGVLASADDVRDDDVNLHWFRKSNNDPFSLAGVVDTGSYSRELADLPPGDFFAAIGSRGVSLLLRGVSDTEAVMHQGQFSDEAQRTLTHDDVAMLKLAMAGHDETAANSDDYSLELSYVGLTTSCDIPLDFDNAQVSFAGCGAGGIFHTATHVTQTAPDIYFNDGFDWFFNDVSNEPPKVPSFSLFGALGLCAACLGTAWSRLRRSAPRI